MKKKKVGKVLLLLVTLISYTIYIVWRTFFTLPFGYGMVSMFFGIALLLSEMIGFIEAISHYINTTFVKNPKMPIIPLSWYPDVDVFIATHNEDVNLLFKTINACLYMKYPDPSKVHIYICDDGNRIEIEELARSFGVGYFGLPENKLAKAGNLNNALQKTFSPYVVTFDADMMPTSDFLMETIPYFFIPMMEQKKDGQWVKKDIVDDVKIGFIQAPQSFYNPDLFQYNFFSEQEIPNEQDFFFREINVSRNASNSPIYAGSNTAISREALERVGYIKTGTITEDFATGIKIQELGYRCYAIDKQLAHGLAPETFSSLIKQRERWGRGCIQTLRSIEFLRSPLPLRAKFSYFTSLLYWWTFIRRFIYIISPILFTVFGVKVLDTNLIQLIIFWLPSYLLYNYTLKITSSNIRNPRWSNIVDTIIFPYLILPIIAESVGIKQKKFAVTNKQHQNNTNTSLLYALPHMLLILGTIFGLINSIEYALEKQYLGDIFLTFWLVVNAYYLLMAIIFMLGRVNIRKEERMRAQLDVIVNTKPLLQGKTYDVSESGFSFKMKHPDYVPYDENSVFYLSSDNYQVAVVGHVVHVREQEDGWLYSIQLEPLKQNEKKQYLQLIYDRDHSLSQVISSSLWNEIKQTIKGRRKQPIAGQRALPRIDCRQQITSCEGLKINLIQYNYEYVVIQIQEDLERMCILIGTTKLALVKVKTVDENKRHSLYLIEDWKRYIRNPDIRKFIDPSK